MKIFSFVLILAILFTTQGIFASEIKKTEGEIYLTKDDQLSIFQEKKGRGEYSESPFRRAEIVFFISLPFMLAINYLAGGAIYNIADVAIHGQSTGPMSDGLFAIMGVSTILCSTAIAIDDYKFSKITENKPSPVGASQPISVVFRYRF